jgi:hypothetical protein
MTALEDHPVIRVYLEKRRKKRLDALYWLIGYFISFPLGAFIFKYIWLWLLCSTFTSLPHLTYFQALKVWTFIVLVKQPAKEFKSKEEETI